MRHILGVDPGVTGAYTVITKGKKRIKVCKLFTDFATALEDLTPYLGDMEACIEKVHGLPQNSTRSVTTFIMNAGGWEGFLAALQVPRTYVTPTVWPKAVLDTQAPRRTTAGIKGKEAAKAQAQNRKIKKLHTTAFVLRYLPKAKKYIKLKKDQDKADAICIALYRRKQLGYKD